MSKKNTNSNNQDSDHFIERHLTKLKALEIAPADELLTVEPKTTEFNAEFSPKQLLARLAAFDFFLKEAKQKIASETFAGLSRSQDSMTARKKFLNDDIKTNLEVIKNKSGANADEVKSLQKKWQELDTELNFILEEISLKEELLFFKNEWTELNKNLPPRMDNDAVGQGHNKIMSFFKPFVAASSRFLDFNTRSDENGYQHTNGVRDLYNSLYSEVEELKNKYEEQLDKTSHQLDEFNKNPEALKKSIDVKISHLIKNGKMELLKGMAERIFATLISSHPTVQQVQDRLEIDLPLLCKELKLTETEQTFLKDKIESKMPQPEETPKGTPVETFKNLDNIQKEVKEVLLNSSIPSTPAKKVSPPNMIDTVILETITPVLTHIDTPVASLEQLEQNESSVQQQTTETVVKAIETSSKNLHAEEIVTSEIVDAIKQLTEESQLKITLDAPTVVERVVARVHSDLARITTEAVPITKIELRKKINNPTTRRWLKRIVLLALLSGAGYLTYKQGETYKAENKIKEQNIKDHPELYQPEGKQIPAIAVETPPAPPVEPPPPTTSVENQPIYLQRDSDRLIPSIEQSDDKYYLPENQPPEPKK